MIISSLIAGKIAVSHTSLGKVAGISMLTSTLSDLVFGSVTYHYWDGKKRGSFTVKKKRRKPKTRW